MCDSLLKQDKGDRVFVNLLLMAREISDQGLDVLEVAYYLRYKQAVLTPRLFKMKCAD